MRPSGESPIRSNGILPAPVRRRHAGGLRPLGTDEWSQWIADAAGDGGWYAPLSTRREDEACELGRAMARRVAEAGWGRAGTGVVREFTLALFWLDAPLACTYATLFTRLEGVVRPEAGVMRRLRVAVVEPEATFRRALVQALGMLPGCSVSGHAGMGELASKDRGPGPDLVLVDRAHAAEGAGRPGAWAREGNGAWVLPFGIYPTSDHIFMSFSGLDAGYLLRRRSLGGLLEPLDGAFVGGRLERTEVGRAVRRYCQGLFSESPRPSAGGASRGGLTLRERQVLTALQRGLHDKEIASELGISPLTVHTHLKHVFEKLGAHTRTEAVVKFLEK